MRPLHGLTDLQLRIMTAVWDRGEASAGDVHEALRAETGLARKTIGTLLMRLEQQGLLQHREEGREFIYHAIVSRDEVAQATVRNLVTRLFEGDLTALLSHALDTARVRPADVERARELLDAWEERPDPAADSPAAEGEGEAPRARRRGRKR